MRKIIIQIFMAILFAMPAISQTVTLTSSLNAVPGPVEFDINMSGFASNGGSVMLFIDYDGDLLSYQNYSNSLNGSVTINANYGNTSVIVISWFNNLGVSLNDRFITLKFNYNGGFSDNLVFKSGCEIAPISGVPFENVTYIGGSITPDLSDPDGIASLGTVSANVGDEVSVPMSLIDNNGGFDNVASSLSFKVAYDVEKLSYVGVSNNLLGLTVGVSNGVISLGLENAITPLDFPPNDTITLIKLNFTYLGGDTTAVEFQPGSIVTNNAGNILITKFEDGDVQLSPPPIGTTLTIGKVSSPGATFEIVPDPPPGTNDTLWILDDVSVPITANGIAELAGVIDLKIAFDNTRLTYSGYTANQFTGWVVTSNQSLGTLSFTKTSATALTITNDPVLTLNFDYLNGIADITFEPETILQKIDGITPIPVNLVNGNVADFSTLNLTVFLEGYYLGGGLMRKAQDNIGAGSFDKFPGTVADQITFELHDATTYSTIVWSINEVNLNTDGTATVSVPRNYAGNYYLTVKHRNHLETVSATEVDFGPSIINFDFTDLASKAYGDNQKDLLDGKFAIFAGDVTGLLGVQDGQINIDDVGPVNTGILDGSYGYLSIDIDGNGEVNIDDAGPVNTNILDGRGVLVPL